jgi:hypothetical protein
VRQPAFTSMSQQEDTSNSNAKLRMGRIIGPLAHGGITHQYPYPIITSSRCSRMGTPLASFRPISTRCSTLDPYYFYHVWVSVPVSNIAPGKRGHPSLSLHRLSPTSTCSTPVGSNAMLPSSPPLLFRFQSPSSLSVRQPTAHHASVNSRSTSTPACGLWKLGRVRD